MLYASDEKHMGLWEQKERIIIQCQYMHAIEIIMLA